jgi:hypothetical protein
MTVTSNQKETSLFWRKTGPASRIWVDPARAVMLDDSRRNTAGATVTGMASILVKDLLSAIAELDALLADSGRPDRARPGAGP